MKYYRRERNGWTAFICVPEKLPNQGLIRLGLRVDRMEGGSFHIDTLYETRDESAFEEKYTPITQKEFDAAYRQALKSFRRIQSVKH